MKYIAHIRGSDGHIQSVDEHLLEVKELAEKYGEAIDVKHICGLAGMLHDMGKYTEEFRTYILAAVHSPETAPKRGSVDHASAGGKLLYELFHGERDDRFKIILAEIVGNAIISHHSYLYDYLSPDLQSGYLHRVKEKVLEEFDLSKKCFFEDVLNKEQFYQYVDVALSELQVFINKSPSESIEKKLMFLTKFIFSALIDADRTNTRKFEENNEGDKSEERSDLFLNYYQLLIEHLDGYTSQSQIPLLRKSMSEQCEQFAVRPSGIYTLSIPTGGGKTLASLRYALKHSMLTGKKRIIYVVPFTTIIEQNAAEVRRILKDDRNILEHHSNVIDDYEEDDEDQDGMMSRGQKLKLARDNWDAPIIFTTMVQFLDVFYAKGTRNIRRLHHLSESVIIFDEVQKVPTSCVSLFNEALNFLQIYCKSSVVLCTATQPALDFVKRKLNISTDGEIVEDLDKVNKSFVRVDIVDRASSGEMSNDQLADFVKSQMSRIQSLLVILNTKSVVKELYQKIKEQGLGIPVYHLSTSMCAAHRNEILEKVKDCLKYGKQVICISTQLIEAGVDISFDCVIRSLAGLDSIAQAAGRCNRHGEHSKREVYIINHHEENLDHLKEIRVGKRIVNKFLIDLQQNPSAHGGYLLSRQAMMRYFQEFYTEFDSDLDYPISRLGSKNMIDLLSAYKKNNSYFHDYCSEKKERLPLFLTNSYRTAAKYFQVISNQTSSVLVPYGAGKDIIAELNGDRSIEDISILLNRVQQYSVGIYSYEKDALMKNGGLEAVWDGKMLVLREGAYSIEYGLDSGNSSPLEFNMF